MSQDTRHSGDSAQLLGQADRALRLSPPVAGAAYDHDLAQSLRGKIVGALIRRERLAAGRDAEECARYLRVEARLIEAWELGESVPSLPQLEALSHFFASPAPASQLIAKQRSSQSLDEYWRIRQRLLGAQLQSLRKARRISLESLSAEVGLDAGLLRRYEYGEAVVPAHHLMSLAQAMRRDIAGFLDPTPHQPAPAPRPASDKENDEAQLQAFAADTRNRAFIRLAMAFRAMDPADLDRVAAALMAIIRDGQSASLPTRS